MTTTNYSFSVSLFDASANPNALQPWLSGCTLTLDSASLEGALTLPGYLHEPVPFSGSTVPPGTEAGTTVVASGKTAEAQIAFTIVYNFDGFLYNGSYLAGLLSLYSPAAQESYLYVLQGLSPQGPFGAKSRGSAGVVDKRKPQRRAEVGPADAGGKARKPAR
jgi:hypothetical protein